MNNTMKKTLIISAYFIVLILSSAVSFSVLDHYEITTGHKIAFKSADPSGTFTKISGTIDFDEANLDSCKFKITIPVSSIDTGNALRDKKAQTAEWFDAKNYPNIKFTSTSVTKDGEKYNVKGDLTLKGIKKEITIPLTYTKKDNKITFKGTFTVNRITFGIGKKSEVVPDNMALNVTVPAILK
jgi:polyisoprenoid-binding protein YceI